MPDYEWDPAKAALNLEKHGIDLADAALALEDPLAETVEDPDVSGERRYVTLGKDAFGRLLVTVWADAGERVRVISARRATPRERRAHEGEKLR